VADLAELQSERTRLEKGQRARAEIGASIKRSPVIIGLALMLSHRYFTRPPCPHRRIIVKQLPLHPIP
jgi:hypothetical protein